ncbi:cyclic di-AMP binding protein CbpA [Alkalicoccus chagannorensis]|uniref:cyclic di-AMP binding protein CbpA n=1 Tax=Alkalicoccus chagannorensis TaxID=427072 RepID=UPI00047A5321|nr:cyclic di-AMP binding protein CbpA [Alkalicoccus chagannorensis]
MKIKYNIIPAENVVTCHDQMTVAEARKTLEESGYRCIPVLDKTGTQFKGNIYAQVLYRELLYNDSSETDNILSLVEDEFVHIDEQASFFRVFTNIKRYPYLAVIDEQQRFSGILTHANVMELLEDSWGIERGNYTMTISTHEYQGALSTIMDSIKKFSTIHSMMTLDNDSTFFRRVIVTLPKETTEALLDQLVQHLEKEGFRVFDIERI